MRLTYIGPSVSICEKCLTRCEGWYEDGPGYRLRLVRCPSCGNGDPQLVAGDHADPQLDLDDVTRFVLYMMHEE